MQHLQDSGDGSFDISPYISSPPLIPYVLSEAKTSNELPLWIEVSRFEYLREIDETYNSYHRCCPFDGRFRTR